MGNGNTNGCCSCGTEQEKCSLDTQVCTETSPELTTTNVQTTVGAINKIKTIKMHRSKVIERVKPQLNLLTHPAINLLPPLLKEELKDKTGLIEPVKPMSETIIRFPTNFKIGPINFRKERKNSPQDTYEIEKSIGKGCFGEVKKIKDKKTGDYRAMKTIDKSNCQMTDSYIDEIEIIKRLVWLAINESRVGSSKCGEILRVLPGREIPLYRNRV